jgi:hypothetical protein
MRRLAATCCLALAACEGDGGPVELDVVEPSATVELLPGGEIDLVWTVTGGDAELVVSVIPLNEETGIVIYDEVAPEGDGSFAWDGLDVSGNLVPPDVYDLDFTLFVDGDPVDSALRNMSVHGVIVVDPGVGETRLVLGSEGETDFVYVTVSQRVIMMTTSVDPDLGVLGDELRIDERSIPGEFVPFDRTVHFDGTDLDGVAIPEGVYTLVVDAEDADAPDLVYRAVGGTVDWRPLE